MLLSIRVSRDFPINWWLVPVGYNGKKPTRKNLVEWYTKAKRKISEGINPLLIIGILSKVGAVVFGIIGVKKENKTLEWLALGLGVSGIIESAGGGSFIYNLLGKTKKSTEHHYHPPQTPVAQVAPPAPSEPDNQEILTVNSGTRPPEHKNQDLFKLIRLIWKTLKECEKLTSEERAKVITEVLKLGNELSIKDLKKCLFVNNSIIKKWAILCLLMKKETDEVNKIIIDNQNDFKMRKILRQLLKESNDPAICKRIQEIIKAINS
jgi:hypothetical protein